MYDAGFFMVEELGQRLQSIRVRHRHHAVHGAVDVVLAGGGDARMSLDVQGFDDLMTDISGMADRLRTWTARARAWPGRFLRMLRGLSTSRCGPTPPKTRAGARAICTMP